MNPATNTRLMPSLIEEMLVHPGHCVDNLFARVWKSLNLNKLIQQAGFKKRTGLSVTDAVFLLLLWKWVNVASSRLKVYVLDDSIKGRRGKKMEGVYGVYSFNGDTLPHVGVCKVRK